MPDESTRPEVPQVGETFRRALDVEVSTSDDGARSTFVVTTSGLARDGMVLEASGLSTEAYARNPVVLWQHGFDAQRGFLPVGRGVNVRREGDRWLADVEWAGDEFARSLGSMVREGFLNAVSIGWRTLDAGWEERDGREVYVIRRAEMVEFSVVAVPADADALVTARAQDADALRREIRALRQEVAAIRAADGPQDTADSEPEPEGAPEADAQEARAEAPHNEQPPTEPDPAPAETATREATPEEIAAATVALLPQIQTAYHRALGRA